jgi:hypothetical protein
MAEFFGGLKGLAVQYGWMRSDEQKKLDDMVGAYAKGGTTAHEHTTIMITHALDKSPDLKARTLEAIRDGHLVAYSDQAPREAGAAGQYSASDRTIQMPPLLGANEKRLADRVFLMGHETEHARSIRGVDYTASTLMPAIRAVAGQPGDGPRDYTDIGLAYIERTRAEEGRAHIGGFNAMASYVSGMPGARPEHLLRDLYETRPERMGDFIEKTSDGIPATYALKPGLALDHDNRMPYSPQNIDAMKVHYADKAQLGAPYMNYPQECIRHLHEVVAFVEKETAIRTREDRAYVIDPERLGARPELGLPEGGLHRVVAIEKVENPDHVTAALTPKEGDHPLFAQAMTGVLELNREMKIDDAQGLRNLAASLALAAHHEHMTRIDRVTIARDMSGVIATQGAGEFGQNVKVGDAAIATPEQQSLDQLPPPLVASASHNASQSQSQDLGAPSSGSPQKM